MPVEGPRFDPTGNAGAVSGDRDVFIGVWAQVKQWTNTQIAGALAKRRGKTSLKVNGSQIGEATHFDVQMSGATGEYSSAADTVRVILPVGGVGAKVAYNSVTPQTLTSGTPTAITFDTVLEDDASFWSGGAPTRLTVPTGKGGRYIVGGQLSYVNNATGTRSTRIMVNGTFKAAINLTPGSSTSYVSHTPTGYLTLDDGDYIELHATQDSGGNLDVGQLSADETPTLWLHKIA